MNFNLDKEKWKDFGSTLRTLFDIADAVCNEIVVFNPDLIIVLAHGGWGPLWASQRLWSEKRLESFPPVLVTNIGTEKMDRYEKARASLPFTEVFPFTADHAGNIECGYFLAWISAQQEWKEMLQAQIMETLNFKPDRILVIDDASFTGETSRLILGLLRSIFPNCLTSMISGAYFEWRVEIAYPWLVEHHIDLENEKEQGLTSALFHFVPGTEDDANCNSLNWRKISTQSSVVKLLEQYLPADIWMKLPGWARRTIQNCVSKIYQNGAKLQKSPHDVVRRSSLKPDEIILCQAWMERKITQKQIAAILNISGLEAQRYLVNLTKRGELSMNKEDEGVSYNLPSYLKY